MAKEKDNKKPEPTKLNPNKPCGDYPGIMQCSTACQNCRFHHFGANHQECRPHTSEEAIRKGAPNVVPPEHLTSWLDNVERRRAEKILSQKQN
jgi:hypothetical protein